MKLSIIPFLANVTAAPPPPSGGLTIVQEPSKVEQGYGTTVERSLSAVGSGNHLIVVVCGHTSGGEPTISDSEGGSWSTYVHSYAEASNGTTTYYYLRTNVTSGLTWVRATYGGGVECRIGVVEVSGSTVSVDSTGGTPQTTDTTWSHAFTSTEDDVVIVGIDSLSNAATATGVSPVTADATSEYFAYFRGLFPTTGSNDAQVTYSDSRNGDKSWIVVKGS